MRFMVLRVVGCELVGPGVKCLGIGGLGCAKLSFFGWGFVKWEFERPEVSDCVGCFAVGFMMKPVVFLTDYAAVPSSSYQTSGDGIFCFAAFTYQCC